MRSLRHWEKSLLRFLPKKFRPVYLFGLAFLSAGIAVILLHVFYEALFVFFNWFGEGAIVLAILRKGYPDWVVSSLVTYKITGLCMLGLALVLFFTGYFWGMRLLFLEKDLPEHCIQEARKIMNEKTEFSRLLERLIEQAMSIDDGCKLGTINFEIRQLIWNRERMVIKQKEIDNLKEEITKQENELNQI